MNNTNDLIRRGDAIDAIRTMQTYKLFAGDDLILVDQAGAQTELMMLPPTQPERKNCETCRYNQLKWDEEPCDSCTGDHWKPERKKGKWIPFDAPWYQCSECGAVRENKSFMENFCPNCGCRMEGGDEDESD